MYNTNHEKLGYLQKLFELQRLDGNKNGWDQKRQEKLDLILTEINKTRKALRNSNNFNCKLEHIKE